MFISPLIDPFALHGVADDTSPKLGGDLNGQSAHDLVNIVNGTFIGTVKAGDFMPVTSGTVDLGDTTNYFNDFFAENVFCSNEMSVGDFDTPTATLDVHGPYVSGYGHFYLKADAGNHCYFTMESPQNGKNVGFYIKETVDSESTNRWLVDYETNSNYLRFYSYADTGIALQINDSRETYMPDVYNHSHGGTGRAMYIQSDGQLTCDTSGLRFKENIRDLTDTSLLFQLRPVLFDWKDGGMLDDVGLVAEEVAAVDSRFVAYGQKTIVEECSEDEDVTRKRIQYLEDKTQIASVHYEKFVPLLIAETQKLRAEVELLKNG